MARDWFTIQATSVSSEHSFSIAFNKLTKVNRLHSTTARTPLCLKSWIINNMVKLEDK